MLLAYEKGAALIVSVGAHFNLVEFLDTPPRRDVLDLPDPAADRRDAGRREGRQPPLPGRGECRAGRTTAGRQVLFPLGRGPARPAGARAARRGSIAGWSSSAASAYLGLLDDLAGGSARGWRGHGLAVARGELSTGAIKAAGTRRPSPPTRSRGVGAERARVPRARCSFWPWRRTSATCSTRARAARRRPWRSTAAARLPRLLEPRPARADRPVARRRSPSCAWLTLRERAMLGRHRRQPDRRDDRRSPGDDAVAARDRRWRSPR